MKNSGMAVTLTLALCAGSGKIFAQEALTVTPAGNVGIGSTAPVQKLEVAGNIAVTGTVDGVDVATFKSDFDSTATRYSTFQNLNQSSTTINNVYTKLITTGSTHTFTKARASTNIEVIVNSRFFAGTFVAATGIRFQVRVDDLVPTFSQPQIIFTSGATEYLSLFSVVAGLPAGSHTVSIWAQVVGGSSNGVVADPGGWGGSIIVKETR